MNNLENAIKRSEQATRSRQEANIEMYINIFGVNRDRTKTVLERFEMTREEAYDEETLLRLRLLCSQYHVDNPHFREVQTQMGKIESKRTAEEETKVKRATAKRMITVCQNNIDRLKEEDEALIFPKNTEMIELIEKKKAEYQTKLDNLK